MDNTEQQLRLMAIALKEITAQLEQLDKRLTAIEQKLKKPN